VLALILIPIAIYLPTTQVEFFLLVRSVMAVLIVEALNTSIEAITDRVSLDRRELSGLAKTWGL